MRDERDLFGVLDSFIYKFIICVLQLADYNLHIVFHIFHDQNGRGLGIVTSRWMITLYIIRARRKTGDFI